MTTSAWLTKSTTETATNAFSCSTAASAAANVVLEDEGLGMLPGNHGSTESRLEGSSDRCYDLAGRLVGSGMARKGIYIQDNKKYLKR